LIAGTYFSISTDETRLHLNSALFEWDGDRVRMVTTDGHRLSKMEAVLPGKHASATMLIPLKGVLELKRLCDEAIEDKGDASGANEIRISQSGPNAFFQLAGFQFSVKLVDAQFPPYDQVIPKENEKVAVCPRLGTLEALKRISIMSSDKTWGIKLSLKKGELRIARDNPDLGEAHEELDVSYEGAPISIGFNAKYFIELLSEMEGDEIKLELNGELDPGLVRPAEAKGYLGVVMPMRI